MDSLEEVAGLVRNCNDCPLGMGRTHAVPGEGPPDAEIMFIGEGPGFQEDRQGRPFVGPAGQFLDGLLASIGMRREEVFIANMIKCRPPAKQRPSTCGNVGLRQISGPANRTHRPQADRHPGTVLPGKVLSRREHRQVAGKTSRERRPPHLSGNAPCGGSSPPGAARLDHSRLQGYTRRPGPSLPRPGCRRPRPGGRTPE